MSNEFEVAMWVAQHPRILNLAKEIQNAKSTPITTTSTTSTNETLQVFSNAPTSNTSTTQEINQVIYNTSCNFDM